MKSNEIKKATLEALDKMIQNAAQGPSGFWVEDYGGCGNPKVFPEFEEGLKKGRLVRKEHFLCPWNTAVLYGKGHGNINTGCYYSCSIEKARFLSEKMMKEVLFRFKKRLMNGDYDCKDNVFPLLTSNEINYIEAKIDEAKKAKERKDTEERDARLSGAAVLIQKYPDEKELFAMYYGQKEIVSTYDGVIDFDPDGFRDIVGAEKFTYDDYIDVQIRSFHKTRRWFASCYYGMPLSFKGCVERKTKDNVCFKRIMVEGMYLDGRCFEGKEDHVWMNIAGFEEYNIGESVTFLAEVYRYVKTGSGKQIDFALRNPKQIEKIESYELPSDNDLLKQEISDIICDTCYLREHCSGGDCLRSEKVRREEVQQMMNFFTNSDSEKADF